MHISEVERGTDYSRVEDALDAWDYSHLLPHKTAYRLEVRTSMEWTKAFWVRLINLKNGFKVGCVDGDYDRGVVLFGVSELNSELRGRGFGKAMYLAALVHGYHFHRLTRARGNHHSELAYRVHKSLADTFGFQGYAPDPICAGTRWSEYSYRFAAPKQRIASWLQDSL